MVDLATAVVLGERPGRFRSWLFRRGVELDRIAVARLRARFLGGDPQAAEMAAGPVAARWHRRGRGIKRLLGTIRKRAPQDRRARAEEP